MLLCVQYDGRMVVSGAYDYMGIPGKVWEHPHGGMSPQLVWPHHQGLLTTGLFCLSIFWLKRTILSEMFFFIIFKVSGTQNIGFFNIFTYSLNILTNCLPILKNSLPILKNSLLIFTNSLQILTNSVPILTILLMFRSRKVLEWKA